MHSSPAPTPSGQTTMVRLAHGMARAQLALALLLASEDQTLTADRVPNDQLLAMQGQLNRRERSKLRRLGNLGRHLPTLWRAVEDGTVGLAVLDQTTLAARRARLTVGHLLMLDDIVGQLLDGDTWDPDDLTQRLRNAVWTLRPDELETQEQITTEQQAVSLSPKLDGSGEIHVLADTVNFATLVNAMDATVARGGLLDKSSLVTDDGSDDAYHAARSTLLATVVPFDPDAAIVAQYEGYRELDDVADDSRVETFAEVRTTIDNDRWRDVPITVRTGKALAADSTVATITLVDSAPAEVEVRNRIRFTVKPNPSVSFDIGVLDATSHDAQPTTIYACGPDDHGTLSDYAVMLDNAMSGDTRHFAQIEDVVACWKIVAEINAADLEPNIYEPGTDGPPRP